MSGEQEHPEGALDGVTGVPVEEDLPTTTAPELPAASGPDLQPVPGFFRHVFLVRGDGSIGTRKEQIYAPRVEQISETASLPTSVDVFVSEYSASLEA